MLTLQEVYDKEVGASATGVFPSYDAKTSYCYYRHPRDKKKKCGVGILFPDNDESEHVYKYNNTSSVDSLPDTILSLIPLSTSQLCSLQLVHDKLASRCREGIKWNHKDFVIELNMLPFFYGINTVDPEKL